MLQSAFDGSQRFLQILNRMAHRDPPNDGALKSGQPGLLRAHHLNEVKSLLLGVARAGYAKRQIQRRLKIVAGVELLFGDSVGRFLGAYSPSE